MKTVLRQFPPPQPKKPAVDLLVAVGDQQQYLLQNGLSPPPGSEGALDALQVNSVPVQCLWQRIPNLSGTTLCIMCRCILQPTLGRYTIVRRTWESYPDQRPYLLDHGRIKDLMGSRRKGEILPMSSPVHFRCLARM